MVETVTRNVAINIRAQEKHRSLIDQAATLTGKNRSDFMLEAACRAAEEVLLDKRMFLVDAATYRAFEASLNAPVGDNPELQSLLHKQSPWEK